MNANLVYCIDCEEVVELLHVHPFGDLHDAARPVQDERGNTIGTDQEDCLFPLGYTLMAPPEITEEWWEDVLAEKQLYFDVELPEEAVHLLGV